MVGSRQDQEMEEAVSELEQEIEETKKKEKSWISKLTPKVKLSILVAFAALLWYVTTYKVPFVKILPWIVIIGLAIYFFTQDEASPRKLTEAETAQMLYNKLRAMQTTKFGGEARLPPGKIVVPPKGKERWFNGKPWKREHGWYHEDPQGIIKHYSSEMNIWDGDLICTRERPAGYRGYETIDFKYLPGKDLRMEKERDRFLKSK